MLSLIDNENKIWVCGVCKSLRSVFNLHFTQHPSFYGSGVEAHAVLITQ